MVEVKKFMLLLLVQHMVLAVGTQFFYHHHHPSRQTDKEALLAFKRSITPDPNSEFAGWNETSDVCDFPGVKCGRLRHRVTKLQINGTGSSGMVGSISPFLANLTGLNELNLSGNRLYGRILPEIGSLKRLTTLDLSKNNLSGEIPMQVSSLKQLKILDLSKNSLSGHIPPELASLQNLIVLELSENQLTGPIPESIAALKQLFYISLRGNRLEGQIPATIFYNCTKLIYADLSFNSLHGEIPSEVGNYLHDLQYLQLSANKFSGKIPPSLSNSSKLMWLDLQNNSLSGELPSEIVRNMKALEQLHLSNNNLWSHNNNTDLETFFDALSNCPSLQELELMGIGLGGEMPSAIGRLSIHMSHINLEDNRITGSIPPNISNLMNLTLLNLSSNLLNGTIPLEIGNLCHLEQLILSNNSLSGEIPATIGQIQQLGNLDISMNRISGQIPGSIGDLQRLVSLVLHGNRLSGVIPSSLGRCMSLGRLDLSYNSLTGEIPKEIVGRRDMGIYLNLSNNHLNGTLPLELGKMEQIQAIDLSSNNLTGNIVPQLSGCIAVILIDLSHNSFEGNLPESFGKLWNLQSLDVSYNNLSGKIPASLNNCSTLYQLNFSFNDFDGSIPTGRIFQNLTYSSFSNNQHLCGSVPGIPICRKMRKRWRKFLILVCTIVSASVFLSTICCVIGYQKIKQIIGFRKIKGMIFPPKDEMFSQSTPTINLRFPRITYRELAEATGQFGQERMIGSGGFGHVYKGVLKDGTVVAVKVLHLQTGNSTKSFSRECQVLKRIRHRNLMRIVTACSLPDFKALVLPFMANGSLESRLYPPPVAGLRSGSSDLNLIQRVNICSDIAEGMAYLHHHSPVRVIHCDLKPSNVLLNDDLTALVSDFGIARLVMTVGGGNGGADNVGNSTANLCGSIGYIAPEYGFGSTASTKGDVYSFGILVLEMVTRKRPTDDMFVSGLTLNKWVKSHYHGRVEKVIDSSLMRSARDQSPEVKKMWEVAIGELLELGLLCTQEAPSTRPTMVDAADDLDRLKRYLTGDTTATFASSLGISSSMDIIEEED